MSKHIQTITNIRFSFISFVLKPAFLFILSFNAIFSESASGQVDCRRVGLENPQGATINEDKSRVYLLYDHYIITVNTYTFLTADTLRFRNLPEPEQNRLCLQLMDNDLYLTDKAGGAVYRLEGEDWLRIDHSYHHRFQSGAFEFVYDHLIFRFGGYGYWGNRNFFTFFDPNDGSVNYLHTTGSVLPPGMNGMKADVVDNQLYVFGGFTLDRTNRFIHQPNHTIFRFDISKREWTKLGETDLNINNYHAVISIGDQFLFSHGNLALLDLNKNKWSSLVPENGLAYIQTSYNVNRFKLQFTRNDSLYFFYLDSEQNNVKVKSVTYSQIEAAVKDVRPFFVHPHHKLVIPVIFVIIFLGASFIFLRRWLYRRNRITYHHGGFRYRGTVLNFTEVEMRVLTSLLQSKSIDNETMFRLIADLKAETSAQFAEKNKVIEAIQHKVSTLLKKDAPVILVERSASDKRYFNYKLNRKLFYQR